jgi:hypothetical protein
MLGVNKSEGQTPDTEIYIVDMRNTENGRRFGTPLNITSRPGYDNQPHFLPDGQSLYYTSIREDGQADIYRYDINHEKNIRITSTPESEYSPTPMRDAAHFSVVRVEADQTQRLWKFDLDGSNPHLVLEDVRSVGYHAWGDSRTVALFIVADPMELGIADLRHGTVKQIAKRVGRSLHKIPGRRSIGFVHKTGEDEWWIKQID